MDQNKFEEAKKNLLRESTSYAENLEDVKGYDFEKDFNINEFLESFSSVGAQATNLGKAIEIVKKMRKEKSFIYLGYTSNQVTTGNREIIKFLVKNKLVDYLVTTAGGIEEDFIKCIKPFKLGSFRTKGKELRENSVNRAGNIYIPNSRYVEFEKFFLPLLEKNKDKIKKTSDIIKLLAENINNEDSIYYWAYKNKIPVYCPALLDGSLGDMVYFFRNKNPDFTLDIAEDTEDLNNSTLGKEKTGIIVLGEGIVKHAICNANMYRDGADYAVYVNTAQEFDASDSGALPEEAVSWGKISTKAESVKVHADATIVFPLLVKGAFVD